MESKLNSMSSKRFSNLLNSNPFLSSYKNLSARIDDCFERYYKNAPFNSEVKDLVQIQNESWRLGYLCIKQKISEEPIQETKPKLKPIVPRVMPISNSPVEAPAKTDMLLKNIASTLESLKEGLKTKAVSVNEERKVEPKIRPIQIQKPEVIPPIIPTPAPITDKEENKISYRFVLIGASIIGIGLFLGKVFFFQKALEPKTVLPYSHVIGPVMSQNKAYLADWFRSNLYVHKLEKGLPIVAVENVPNRLMTGLAVTPDNLWTIDGFGNRILQHALTPEHLILHAYAAPGKKSRGLYFDGKNLWSGDEDLQVLYRYKGTDINSIQDEFGFSDITLTSFQVIGNSVWILDKGLKRISQYKLQKPLALVKNYDFSSHLDSAEPRGFVINDDQLIITTENPSLAFRFSLQELNK